MGGIFISYRREDSSAYAGRLYDQLCSHFGDDEVFIDIDSIGPGEDFREVIKHTCASCEIFLVVIGRSWATIRDRSGRARLEDETDYVRFEVSSALRTGLRVIPVLVGGAEMPVPGSLPLDLASLAFRNAWEVSDKRFRSDVAGLVQAIEKAMHVPVARGTGLLVHIDDNESAELPTIAPHTPREGPGSDRGDVTSYFNKEQLLAEQKEIIERHFIKIHEGKKSGDPGPT